MNRETLSPELLLRHADWVRRLAHHLVHDEHRACDVVQQTWLVALREPPSRDANLRAWFARVVRSVIKRSRVAEERRVVREQRAARSEISASAEDAVRRAEMHASVVAAVLALAEPYRSTIVLRFFEDLSAREIAEREQLPIETVRTRLKRAVAQLRTTLDDDLGVERASACLAILASGSPAAGPSWHPPTFASTAASSTGGTMIVVFQWAVASIVVLASALTFASLGGGNAPPAVVPQAPARIASAADPVPRSPGRTVLTAPPVVSSESQDATAHAQGAANPKPASPPQDMREVMKVDTMTQLTRVDGGPAFATAFKGMLAGNLDIAPFLEYLETKLENGFVVK